MDMIRPADVVSFRYYDGDSGVQEGEGVIFAVENKQIYIQTANHVRYNHKMQQITLPPELISFPLAHWLGGYLEIKIIDN
jgi:hypothetical protein